MVFVLINIYNTSTEIEQLQHFQFSKYFRQSKRYSKQNIFFLSNLLQESVNKTNVLAAFSTDHSPLLFSLGLSKDENRGKTL